MLPNSTPFTGRASFQAALRDWFAEAAAAGCRELVLCDPDFADWPLGESAVIDSLTAWAGPQRRLTLLALNFDAVARRHPRFVAWRARWSHLVTCRALPELQADDVPVLAVATMPAVIALRVFEPLRHHGVVSREPADSLVAKEQTDAISQRSVEAFPVTSLGL
jgi:hypothetical protein